MAKNQLHIDDLLRGKLTDATANTDGISWADFEKKRNKKRIIWWPYSLTAGIVIACLGIYTILDFSHTSESENMVKSRSTAFENVDLPQNKDSEVNEIKSPNGIVQALQQKEKRAHSTLHKRTPLLLKTAKESPLNAFQFYSNVWLNQKPIWVKHKTLNNIKANTIASYQIDFDTVKLIDESSLVETFKPKFIGFEKPNYYLLNVKIGYAHINPNFVVQSAGQNRIHKLYKGIRDQSESGVLGLAFTAAIGKEMGRFEPYIGIGFSQLHVFGNYNFSYSEFPVLDVDGTILEYRGGQSRTVTFESRQKITTLNVPLSLDFRLLSENRIDVFLNQTYTPQFVLSVGGETPNPVYLDVTENLKGTSKALINNYQVGFTADYKLSLQTSIYFQPYYNKSFGLKNTVDLYKWDLNTFGFNFGLKKHLSY